MIPETFEQWQHCMTVDCGLALTPGFCAQRLQALNNPRDHHTQRLIALYGADHLSKLIQWFEQAS